MLLKSVQICQQKKLYNMSSKSKAVPKTASKKVPKAAAPKKPSVKAEHPTYFEMTVAAITAMKDRRGSSRQAIQKYILENYKVDAVKMIVRLRLSLRNNLAKGKLRYARETGKGSSCYKLVPKEKEVKKSVVKKVAKKTVGTKKAAAKKEKEVKKPGVKKIGNKVDDKKKAAAKKTTDKVVPKDPKKALAKTKTKASAEKSVKKAIAKKSPLKKPVPKKSATKKTMAKKSTEKVAEKKKVAKK